MASSSESIESVAGIPEYSDYVAFVANRDNSKGVGDRLNTMSGEIRMLLMYAHLGCYDKLPADLVCAKTKCGVVIQSCSQCGRGEWPWLLTLLPATFGGCLKCANNHCSWMAVCGKCAGAMGKN